MNFKLRPVSKWRIPKYVQLSRMWVFPNLIPFLDSCRHEVLSLYKMPGAANWHLNNMKTPLPKNSSGWNQKILQQKESIPCMYGTFTYIYHNSKLNVGKYTIHGLYGFEYCNQKTSSLYGFFSWPMRPWNHHLSSLTGIPAFPAR